MNQTCTRIGHKWIIRKRTSLEKASAETILLFPACLRCGKKYPFEIADKHNNIDYVEAPAPQQAAIWRAD